jgi:hypothetical protein
MLFGTSWTKSPLTSIGEEGEEKAVATSPPSNSKSKGSKEDEWFVLKKDENVAEVATFSKPSITDPSYEVIGSEEEEDTKERPKAGISFEEIRPLPGRPDQLFHAVEQMWAKNTTCLTNEKWRAILILLLCSVVARLDLLCATKEEDVRVPVPIVIVDEKPSPVYEAYMMMPPPEHITKPAAKPNVGSKSTDYLDSLSYEDLAAEKGSSDLRGSRVVQQSRENSNAIIAMTAKTIYVSTSPSQRPAKPLAISMHELSGMKAGGDDASVNQTDFTSSAFIDPRPRPSPAHAQQRQSPDEDIIQSLNKRIGELQAINEEYMERLTQMTMETSSWQSRAVSCDQELASIKKRNEDLLAKTQRPTKGTDSFIPIPTVPNQGWKFHREEKLPMASNAIPDNDMMNVSIPYVGDVMALKERSIRHVGPTALIPSPA